MKDIILIPSDEIILKYIESNPKLKGLHKGVLIKHIKKLWIEERINETK